MNSLSRKVPIVPAAKTRVNRATSRSARAALCTIRPASSEPEISAITISVYHSALVNITVSPPPTVVGA